MNTTEVQVAVAQVNFSIFKTIIYVYLITFHLIYIFKFTFSVSESNLTNNDGWVDWIWSWVPSVNLTTEFNEVPLSPDTVVSGHTLNTGIYIDTLYIILKVSI